MMVSNHKNNKNDHRMDYGAACEQALILHNNEEFVWL